MENNLLELKGICKSFYGVPALVNVDFSVQAGKVHALVGGNGAGKSTLMKILTGVYTKDDGEIILNGQPVQLKSYGDAVANGISMIFQEMSGVPTLSVTENIFLNNEIKRGQFLDRRAMRQKAVELLEKLDVKVDPDATLASLSVGQKQMVEITKALARNTRILVMDEPTASLTHSEVVKLFGIIRNLQSQGISIVYISHRMNEIIEIADDVTILRDGCRVAHLEKEELSLEAIISNMMGSKSASFEWLPPDHEFGEEPLLELQDVTVNDWIEHVNLSLHKGEVLGIAGLLSSGRSEILETIFGIRRLRSGSIRIEGKPVRINSVNDGIKAGIGLVPEDRRTHGLVLMHSVKDNLTIPFLNKLNRGPLLDEGKIAGVTNEAIEDLNIKTDSIDKIVAQLSGGNQQKIVIAKWLKSDMKILLLDEPTAGVDIGAKKELISIIRSFANQGNGAIFVSSEMAELMSVCDRILIIKKGTFIEEFTHAEIASEEVLQNAIQH
ncbi:sugar ABC transporter ATP-binding protein [uncultured Anaerotruncus sp.]|uniref:sugar ABC transporter ATP-binding protein n=1 Tax=uncultured Anaerotruncus sp. TaxID=905011 RepID=UPI00280B8D07|nr:sugar ABC transporter ATP-binding protein [uncultured Anaerotruncus sp.]